MGQEQELGEGPRPSWRRGACSEMMPWTADKRCTLHIQNRSASRRLSTTGRAVARDFMITLILMQSRGTGLGSAFGRRASFIQGAGGEDPIRRNHRGHDRVPCSFTRPCGSTVLKGLFKHSSRGLPATTGVPMVVTSAWACGPTTAWRGRYWRLSPGQTLLRRRSSASSESSPLAKNPIKALTIGVASMGVIILVAGCALSIRHVPATGGTLIMNSIAVKVPGPVAGVH